MTSPKSTTEKAPESSPSTSANNKAGTASDKKPKPDPNVPVKVAESFFAPRKSAFPDARNLGREDEPYSNLYHTIENWEGLRRWKTDAELTQIRQHYYGENGLERRYVWLAELNRHKELSGSVIGVHDEKEKYDLLDDFRQFFHQARDYVHDLYPGTNILDAFDPLFIGLMFGRHVYIEGSSGIGKTEIVRRLCRILSLPYQQYDAYADATDLSLLGGEVPVTTNGSISFSFERGPLLTPGLLGLVIDELPRLPASTSNVLLQAMAERKVNVSLVASGRGTATVLLSPQFIVIGTGNPVGYGGQGERSFALFDRFDIGIEMKHPGIEARSEILRQHGNQRTTRAFDVKPHFTLNGINSLVQDVQLSPLFIPIMVTAAHALGPKDFLDRTNTENPGKLTKDKPDYVSNGAERVMWEAAKQFAKKHKSEFGQLSQMVEENLTEGSNPRGEISVVHNAKALALIKHDVIGKWAPPQVYLDELGRAFHWANYARLKTYPGAEGKRGALLDQAKKLLFNANNWIAVMQELPDSAERNEAIRALTQLGVRA